MAPGAQELASRATVPSAAALRLARLVDAGAIAALYAEVRSGEAESGGAAHGVQNGEDVGDWLENGGALVLEDERGQLVSALLWREERSGWRLDPLATLEDYRGQGFGRWMMTKVEALAIRENVSMLALELAADRGDLLHYYTRMGYRQEGAEGERLRLSKPVGGTWQTKGRA